MSPLIIHFFLYILLQSHSILDLIVGCLQNHTLLRHITVNTVVMLSQEHDNGLEHVVAYASQALSKAER